MITYRNNNNNNNNNNNEKVPEVLATQILSATTITLSGGILSPDSCFQRML
jgi:hypothetical protein